MFSVLLIEDWAECGRMFKILLEMKGHKVTWVVGAKQAAAENLHAVLESGDEVNIQPSDFQVALVDGNLRGDLDGWDIVPALAKAGVISIAISSGVDQNAKMIKAGARLSVCKEYLIMELDELLECADALNRAAA